MDRGRQERMYGEERYMDRKKGLTDIENEEMDG